MCKSSLAGARFCALARSLAFSFAVADSIAITRAPSDFCALESRLAARSERADSSESDAADECQRLGDDWDDKCDLFHTCALALAARLMALAVVVVVGNSTRTRWQLVYSC